ncbi:hypothetical protein JCM11641_000980 [Rhodosporidiobolus odoratus]
MATPKPRFFLGKPKSTSTSTSSSRPSSNSTTGTGTNSKPPPPPVDKPIALDGDTRLAEYSSPDDVCPVCKNDRYLNPKLRLMVSKCYHKMCESCLDRLFSLGPEPCPVCGQTIRKAQFQPQIFQNLEVQKEVAVRRRVAKIFNKRPEDFPTPSSYNDYLETSESLTFSLIHSIGSDLVQTESKIRSYELANRQSIEVNEERGFMEREEEERRERGEREWKKREGERVRWEREEEEREREEERRRVVRELEQGDLPPEAILAASAARTRTNALKRSSARGSSSSPHDPSSSFHDQDVAFAKLQFLSSLGGGGSSSLEGADEETEPIDPLEDYILYDDYTSLFTLLSPPSAYQGDIGTLVRRERERGTEGGFRVEEVWEKAVRGAVVGLWEVPLGQDRGGGGEMAMEVEMVA